MSPGQVRIERPARWQRIAFAGDFLRFEVVGNECQNFQSRNVAWLQEILAPALHPLGAGIAVHTVMAPRSVDGMLSASVEAATIEEYRQDPAGAWARRYDDSGPTCLHGVFEELCKHDLVIGYEMPPVVKRHLHRNGRPYLNLYIHPLRFLRDLCFGFTTNATWIAERLAVCWIASDEVERQAHRLKAMFRHRLAEACAVPAGLPVLVGQTAQDSVLIRDGRFDTWQDHSEELASLLNPFDAIVFLEHPQRPSSSTVVEYLRSELGKTVVSTNANGYGVLMSNTDIPKVLTLASSLGVEADAIGLDAKFLLDDPRLKFVLPEIESSDPAPCGHGVLHADFWAGLVNKDKQRRSRESAAERSFAYGDNYLRNSLAAWSYRAIQNGLETLGARKILVPSAHLDADARDLLLGGMVRYQSDARETPASALQRARAVSIQLEVQDPPLRIGERRSISLSSSASAMYLISGFHPAESWGGWSSALRSEMAFPVVVDAAARGTVLRLVVRLKVYDGILPSSPVLRLSHSQGVLGYVFFRPGSVNSQLIELELPVSGPRVHLCFDLTNIDSPAARGESVDARWLGFALHEVEIECAASTQRLDAHPEAGIVLWGIDRAARRASESTGR
jgi:hypothetical protein